MQFGLNIEEKKMKIEALAFDPESKFMKALNKVFSTSFGYEINDRLYELQKEIAEHAEYYVTNKNKIFKTHGKEENGRYSLVGSSEGFKELLELQQKKVEIKTEKIEIPKKEIKKIKDFPPNERFLVSKVVDFVDDTPKSAPESQKKEGDKE
jgi:predicted RNA-binding protein with PUA domain